MSEFPLLIEWGFASTQLMWMTKDGLVHAHWDGEEYKKAKPDKDKDEKD